MKKLFLFVFAGLGICGTVHSQTFLNGSFEKNSAGQSCGYNLPNADIDSKMNSTVAFGKYEAIDILIAGCIINDIADGNYALGIANEPSNPTNGEAFSLELSETLTENQQYEISFKVQAITKYGPQGNLLIGISSQNNTFGNEVFKAFSADGKWITSTFKFTATKDIKFITIKPEPGKKSWNIVDDFNIKKL